MEGRGIGKWGERGAIREGRGFPRRVRRAVEVSLRQAGGIVKAGRAARGTGPSCQWTAGRCAGLVLRLVGQSPTIVGIVLTSSGMTQSTVEARPTNSGLSPTTVGINRTSDETIRFLVGMFPTSIAAIPTFVGLHPTSVGISRRLVGMRRTGAGTIPTRDRTARSSGKTARCSGGMAGPSGWPLTAPPQAAAGWGCPIR